MSCFVLFLTYDPVKFHYIFFKDRHPSFAFFLLSGYVPLCSDLILFFMIILFSTFDKQTNTEIWTCAWRRQSRTSSWGHQTWDVQMICAAVCLPLFPIRLPRILWDQSLPLPHPHLLTNTSANHADESSGKEINKPYTNDLPLILHFVILKIGIT